MELLIKNAQIYKDGQFACEDILVRDGCFAPPAQALPGAEVLDGEGCLLAPGFCDMHVHLREPGFTEKETVATGTAAAAAGGFTVVCAMPNVLPVPDSAETLAVSLQAARGAGVRVLHYAAITKGEAGEELADIEALAPQVAGFSDDGRGVQSEQMMHGAMVLAKKCGKMIVAHCENEVLLPEGGVCVQENSAFAAAHGFTGHSNESEWNEVERDIRLCEETGCRLHICHASTEETFRLVREAKQRGLPVTCEVTPHNLLLSCDDIQANNGKYKMNPPLRNVEDRNAAVAALLDGTADVVATDHAPHAEVEKAGGFAHALNGVTGLEPAFAALYTGLCMPGRVKPEWLVEKMAVEPRRILGLAAPGFSIGARADFTLLDVKTERVCDPAMFRSKGHSTPFAGMALRGWPVLTFAAGKEVFRR